MFIISVDCEFWNLHSERYAYIVSLKLCKEYLNVSTKYQPYCRKRTEHFYIWISFMCHYVQELQSFKNCVFWPTLYVMEIVFVLLSYWIIVLWCDNCFLWNVCEWISDDVNMNTYNTLLNWHRLAWANDVWFLHSLCLWYCIPPNKRNFWFVTAIVCLH